MAAGREDSAAPAARHFILGTAGHVDHGKTELVRALTGHDTDRLKEEKERGISIELGFAPLQLAADVFVGIIDVPGHERFVRQMVAGAGGIDMAMLLVAADEGVMPQTTEHIEVLRSLGIKHGLVVISKSDLATADTLPLLQEDIAQHVRGTFLERAAVIPVSARTGAGLDTLRATLLELARAVDVRSSDGPFRLAVDRVFHQKGIGVVVTGSGYSGRVRVGDELDLLPEGTRVRVREIQSFAHKRTEGLAGERLALALHGVKLDDIERGDTLATPGQFNVTHTVDVRLVLSAHDEPELANRERVRIHHGSREALGRVILFECDVLRAGESALAQLRLETPLVAGPGDRIVIRSYSPAHVMGGAIVLEPRGEAHRRSDTAALERLRLREQGDPAEVLAKMVERAGLEGMNETGIDSALCAAMASRGVITIIAGRAYHGQVLADLAAHAIEIAGMHTRKHPLQWGIDKEELRRRLGFRHSAAVFNRVIETLAASHPLFVRESRVRGGSLEITLAPELEKTVQSLRARVRDAGVAFPSRDELAATWRGPEPLVDALTLLRDRGDVVEIGDGVIDPGALDRATDALRSGFAGQAELSVGDFKDALGITRKHAIPLLEFFDQRGYTVRKGNTRLAGSGLSHAKNSG